MTWLGSGYDLHFFETKKQLIWKKSFLLSKSKIGAEDFNPESSFIYNQRLKKGIVLVREMAFGQCVQSRFIYYKIDWHNNTFDILQRVDIALMVATDMPVQALISDKNIIYIRFSSNRVEVYEPF